LVATFIKLSKQEIDEDDMNGEGTLAASGCLISIKRLVIGIKSTGDEMLNTIEKIIYPAILMSLTPDGLDNIDEALEIVMIITGEQTKVTPVGWNIFTFLISVLIEKDE
jgi:hypothetical protein